MRAEARFVRKDRRVHHDAHCLYCGSYYGICKGEARACRVTVCLACASPQCRVNGLSRGQCSICYVGLLREWSSTDRPCRYTACEKRAVARDGAWSVCAEHLERRKPGYVAKQLQARDAGLWILAPAADVPAL